ncbi:MAG: hypothetical protein ACRD33_00175 [Candidatus Acidiferrales bacterium]
MPDMAKLRENPVGAKKIALKRNDKYDPWNVLTLLIANYADACRAHETRGGEDPADFEVIDATLELERLRLMSHIQKMRREFDPVS